MVAQGSTKDSIEPLRDYIPIFIRKYPSSQVPINGKLYNILYILENYMH